MWVRAARSSIVLAYVLVTVVLAAPIALVKVFGQPYELILITLMVSPLPVLLLPVLLWVKERPVLTRVELDGRSLRLSYWSVEPHQLELDLLDVRDAFWERGRLVLRVPGEEVVLVVPPNLMADAEHLVAAVDGDAVQRPTRHDGARLELGRAVGAPTRWALRALLLSYLGLVAWFQGLLAGEGVWQGLFGLGLSTAVATLTALLACQVQAVVVDLDGPRLRVSVSRVLPTPAWSVLLSEVRAVSVRGRRVMIELRGGRRRTIPMRRTHDAERVAALLEARLVTEEPVPQEVRRLRRAASRVATVDRSVL